MYPEPIIDSNEVILVPMAINIISTAEKLRKHGDDDDVIRFSSKKEGCAVAAAGCYCYSYERLFLCNISRQQGLDDDSYQWY